jgi:hypothetical protein
VDLVALALRLRSLRGGLRVLGRRGRRLRQRGQAGARRALARGRPLELEQRVVRQGRQPRRPRFGRLVAREHPGDPPLFEKAFLVNSDSQDSLKCERDTYQRSLDAFFATVVLRRTVCTRLPRASSTTPPQPHVEVLTGRVVGAVPLGDAFVQPAFQPSVLLLLQLYRLSVFSKSEMKYDYLIFL